MMTPWRIYRRHVGLRQTPPQRELDRCRPLHRCRSHPRSCDCRAWPIIVALHCCRWRPAAAKDWRKTPRPSAYPRVVAARTFRAQEAGQDRSGWELDRADSAALSPCFLHSREHNAKTRDPTPGTDRNVQPDRRRSPCSTAMTRFEHLHAWIADNLRGDLSVASLADAACMSERSFVRHYRRTTGMTPARTIERIRVEAAAKCSSKAFRSSVSLRAVASVPKKPCAAASCACSV